MDCYETVPESVVSLFVCQAFSYDGDLQRMLGRILLQSLLSERVRGLIYHPIVGLYTSPTDCLTPVIGSHIRRRAKVDIVHDPISLRIYSEFRYRARGQVSNLSHMYKAH